MMNERMGESLSALMDEEANELELERVLGQVAADGEVRQGWKRYNLAQHAVQGYQLAHLDWDISERVQSALAASPSNDRTSNRAGLKQRLLRPLTSFAVAASVAATVVIGGQQLAQISGKDDYGVDRSVATSASPVGMVNSLGATAVRASYGTQAIPVLQPATRTAYDELAQRRLRKYMQEHAEQAALNSPQGLLPFARIPEIRE
jgi:sigma-E factor negative regulatory protein RseA